MMNGVHIRPTENGYIIDVVGRERIATTLEEVLSFLLLHFEGRADTFKGELYGYVYIERSAPPDPEPIEEPAPPPNPAPDGPPTFMCPICYRDDFKRLVGVIGHAYAKHGQTLTAKDIVASATQG